MSELSRDNGRFFRGSNVSSRMDASSTMTWGSLTTPRESLPPGVVERFVDAGGVRFRYLVGGKGEATPILFLHGWPTWAEVWLRVGGSVGLRHPWIAVDLPCQNRSSLLPGGDRSLSAYRTALDAFVDDMEYPRFAVVGNSMGGTLAVMVTIDRPDRVSRLVMIDAAGLTPKLPGRTARMYLPFLLACFFGAPGPARVKKLLTKAVFHDARFADDAWVSSMVAGWKPRERRKALVATALALRRPDASVASLLEQIRVPSLVISGREDPQFPWRTALDASRRIRGATFSAVEEAGHFPMVEKPLETADLISKFLD